MRFSREELLRLTNILDNAGQIFLGGLVISPIFLNIHPLIMFAIILVGIILTFVCWIISLRLAKRITGLKWKS